MSALREYRQVWRVTITQREEGRRFLFSTGILLVLAAAIFTFGLAFVRDWRDPALAPRMLMGAGGAWLALVWAMAYMPVSLVLHAGANARLVPRQRRRLMQVAAALWLLACAAIAVAAADWRTGALAGLMLLAYAHLLVGRKGMVVVLLVAGNWSWLSRTVVPAAVAGPVGSTAGQAVLALLLLAVAAWTLPAIYPDGPGACLERQAQKFFHARRPAARRHRLYAAALRRDVRLADPGRLLMHALGPVAHWTAWIASAATLLALGGIGRLALELTHVGPANNLLKGLNGLGLLALPLMVAFSTVHYGQALRKRRGEQALVRLTPRAGEAASLNRRLATQLLRHAALGWAVLTAASVAVTSVLGMGSDAVLHQFALCCLGGQMAVLALLGDYAVEGGPRLPVALAVLFPVLECLLAAGVGWWMGPSAWPWLMGLAVIGAVLAAWRGWRRMLAAPVAFPAGRMA